MTGIKSPTCARGHAMRGTNVYIRKDGKGRQCKACAALRQKVRRRKVSK